MSPGAAFEIGGAGAAPPAAGRKQTRVQRVAGRLDEKITRFFGEVGRRVARRPLLTVAICVLVFLACAWRVPVTFDEQETRADKLFTPQKSDSFTAEEYVYGTYGVPERVGEVYFVASGWDEDAESNDNVLTKEVLIGMLNWYERVMLATKADYEGETLMWTSDTICYRPGGVGTACDVASVLDLWSYDRAALEADGDVLATIQAGFAQGSAATDALGRPLSAKALIGGADTQVPGELTSAQALRLLFRAQNNEVKMESGPDKGEYMDPRVDLWERTLTAETKVWTAGEGVVDVRALTVGNEDEEAGGAITGDLQYLGIGCVVLLLYAAHVLGSNRAVESSAWLTLPSVLSIGMAITCSLGLGGLMGLTFNNAVQVAFFILLGIGIDDTFVIAEHLYGPDHQEAGDEQLPVEERIAKAIAKAGSSILVTSATDIIAFLAGMFTTLPALSAFCGFTALGILFDFVFQITFFVAFLTWDLKRRDARKRDCCCCPCCGPSGIGRGTPCCGAAAAGTDSAAPPKSFSYKVAAEWLPSLTLTTPGKVVVLSISAGLLALGCVGATSVGSDFNIEWFTPADSPLRSVYAVRDLYFRGRQVPFGIYTQEVEGAGGYYGARAELAALTAAMGAHKEISLTPPPDSWYITWAAEVGNATDVAAAWTSAGALGDFLGSPTGTLYASDVSFGADAAISHTRMSVFMEPQEDGMAQVAAMQAVRDDLTEAAPSLGVLIYSKAFVFWEGLAVIKGETVRNVIVAACLVFVVCVLLLADLIMSLVVLTMVALVDVQLLGFMYLWGLSYNSVSFVFLVVSIGIAVDYSVHIARAFMSLRGSRTARTRGALREIGGAVLEGAVSTMIPVAILGLASSYVFQVFHQMLVSIIVLGAFNGLIVLPVLLSLVGSAPLASATKRCDEEGRVVRPPTTDTEAALAAQALPTPPVIVVATKAVSLESSASPSA